MRSIQVMVLGWVAIGCGTSTAELKRARSSAYNTDFLTVWNAVRAEITQEFTDEGVFTEDAAEGVLVSKFRPVAVQRVEGTKLDPELEAEWGGDMHSKRSAYEQSVYNNIPLNQRQGQEKFAAVNNRPTNMAAPSQGIRFEPLDVPGRLLWRVSVHILPGGPPWRLAIDGEAARLQPGDATLTPIRHGASDEPGWIDGRIEAFTVAVHGRLKGTAVSIERP
jgi:hypothetical protein